MSEEERRAVAVIEAHQEMVSRIEEGSSKMRMLSLLTIAVALLLALGYASQLATPYLTGQSSELVSLTDPLTVLFELLLLGLVLAWLYVGVSDFRFTSRMRREIEVARTKEKEIERRLT